MVAGDRAAAGDVPDDVLVEQGDQRLDVAARVEAALEGVEAADDALGVVGAAAAVSGAGAAAQPSGPDHSKGMCLLDLPAQSHRSPKASAWLVVAVP